jgi:hypothetical protein
MHKVLLSTALLSYCTALLWVPDAHATLISLGMQETGVNGDSIVTVATDSGTGVLSYSGAYGTFSFNTVSATGFPVVAQPIFLTNSIDVSTAAAGTLNIYITEQGLTLPLGAHEFLSTLTANQLLGSTASVTMGTLVSPSNQLYGDDVLAPVTTFMGLGVNADIDFSPALAGLYSETALYTIEAFGVGMANDTIDITSVPEPGSLAILSLGMLGIALIRRRLFMRL